MGVTRRLPGMLCRTFDDEGSEDEDEAPREYVIDGVRVRIDLGRLSDDEIDAIHRDMETRPTRMLVLRDDISGLRAHDVMRERGCTSMALLRSAPATTESHWSFLGGVLVVHVGMGMSDDDLQLLVTELVEGGASSNGVVLVPDHPERIGLITAVLCPRTIVTVGSLRESSVLVVDDHLVEIELLARGDSMVVGLGV